jgi:cytochrome c556
MSDTQRGVTMNKLLIATALLTLAACNREGGDQANATLNEANVSGTEASATVQNAVLNSADTPLERSQAVALMKQRYEGYEQIGKAMRAAKQGIDRNDPAAVKTAADRIATIAPQAIGWFPAGTGPDVGKTGAKPEIWQQRAEFDRGMERFQGAARNFQQAAASGDIARMKAAHGDLGKTCGSCHDRFRTKDN